MAMTMTSETFEAEGVRWYRQGAEACERYIVGLDLGQSCDPSALCVIHHKRTPLETCSVIAHPNRETGTLKQDVDEHLDVLHLERLRLGMSYVDQIAYGSELLARAPLYRQAEFVLDETGCGRPVSDMFEDAGLKPIRIMITAGYKPERHGNRRWGVPKATLISSLDSKLHTGALKIAAALLEAPALKEELSNFHRHVTASGRATFEARGTAHDDLVLAVAIAAWWSDQWRKQQMRIGATTGFY